MRTFLPPRLSLSLTLVLSLAFVGVPLLDGGPSGLAPAVGAAPSALAPRPAAWPGTLQLGMAASPRGAAALKASALFGFRYQYLAGGTNTGGGWATWNPNGRFATLYIQDSVANGITLLFTYPGVGA